MKGTLRVQKDAKMAKMGGGGTVQGSKKEMSWKKSCCKAVGDECLGSRLGFKAYGSGFRFEGLGEATISRLLKILGLVCRIQSLSQGSFAKKTCNFKKPTNRSHHIGVGERGHIQKVEKESWNAAGDQIRSPAYSEWVQGSQAIRRSDQITTRSGFRVLRRSDQIHVLYNKNPKPTPIRLGDQIGLGFRSQGLKFRVQGIESWSGFRVQGLGLGFRLQGLRF